MAATVDAASLPSPATVDALSLASLAATDWALDDTDDTDDWALDDADDTADEPPPPLLLAAEEDPAGAARPDAARLLLRLLPLDDVGPDDPSKLDTLLLLVESLSPDTAVASLPRRVLACAFERARCDVAMIWAELVSTPP